MSNTKQQNPPDPVEMLYIESPSISLKQFREAIDRLVTDARIDELKHIVSNSEWSDDDFYWYEVTREEYEGTKYYSEVRHLKRGQRIAELQSQLTNKEYEQPRHMPTVPRANHTPRHHRGYL